MSEASSQFISIHTLGNRFEADVIMEALRQEGIPALLRSFEETPYTGLFVPQKGWGRVLVPKEMETQARNVISALAEDEECDEPSSFGISEIDPHLWEMLRQADPQEIIRKAVVEYNLEEHAYVVPFLNTAILCYPEEEAIEVVGELDSFSKDFQLNLVVLHYLLGAQESPLSNKLISEKDLPGGNVFFTASHTLPVEALADTFDARPQLLHAGAHRLGGKKVNLGDLSYQFWVLPRIPLVVVFWAGDEEFSPSLHILFDETISKHLASLDLVWGLVNVFIGVILESSTGMSEGEQNE